MAILPIRRTLALLVCLLSISQSVACAPPPALPAKAPATQDAVFAETFDDEAWAQRWRERSINGHTQYARVVADDGNAHLRASSHAAASYLAHIIRFDPRRTAQLTWRWQVVQPVAGEDLRTKRGSDVAARVYVLFDTGPLLWQKRLVTYVWSNRLPPGTQLYSAYSKDAGIIVLRGPETPTGQWQQESRNVAEDYRALFARNPPMADGLGLQTDTDSTGGDAAALFDDIVLRP